VQNGDINHRIQVIEQNGKDIPFISIDLLRRLLPILNRYIEIFDILTHL